MKKPKSLETKLRSAIRLIWSRSAERRAILKAAIDSKTKYFLCPLCENPFPDWAAEVDHIEPIGSLESWRDTVVFIDRMFFSPQRVVCKTCHRAKTKEDMKKIRARHKKGAK
jgi:hypothetical protein